MDFFDEILFLITITQEEIENYLDAKYGHEYYSGRCEYWSYETDEEKEERVNQSRMNGLPVALDDLVFSGASSVEHGKCVLTGKEGKCRVIQLVG